METQITMGDCFVRLRAFKKQNSQLNKNAYLLMRHLVSLVLPEVQKHNFSLSTNNRALATEIGCVPKTIQRLTQTLIEIKLILKKERKSRGIILHFNPKFFAPDGTKLPSLVPVGSSSSTQNKIEDWKSYVENPIFNQNSARTLEHSPPFSCEYSEKFSRAAEQILYSDRNLPEGTKSFIRKNIFHHHFSRATDPDKKVDKYILLTEKLHEAKKWFLDHPHINIPTPFHYFSIADHGIRFNRFLEYAGKKKLTHKNKTIRWAIDYQAKDFREGKSSENKHDIIIRHSMMIEESNSSAMKTWFLKNSPKLYSTWKA